MSHFTSYVVASSGGNVEKLKAEGEWMSWPQQIDFAEYISGSFFSEQAGTLIVEECFDLPSPSEAAKYTPVEWAEHGHWVPASWAEFIEVGKIGESKQEARFKIEANQSLSWTVFAGAPYWRLHIINGKTETKSLRAYARAFERGKV